LYRTRKGDEWITFVDCMFKGYSLRKSADIVGVTWVTLFYWRHKLLNALKQMDFEHFDGIVEVDETYFSYSQKGQRGITDRQLNLVNVAVNLSTEGLATNRYVFSLPETEQKLPFPKLLVWVEL
jgi:hypothetical protein